MPEPAFLKHARAVCDKAGAALILDDVRAGFRLDVRGSWAMHGVKPDLGAYSKAIANGWPLAALAGSRRMLEGASKIFTTGSFWYGSAAMAASIKTINILKNTDALPHMQVMGVRLREGLASIAQRHGFVLHQTGPAQMPILPFENHKELQIANAFCAAALRHGLYLHPRHNMFLSAAHQPADIDRALEGADAAMKDLASAGFKSM
jgi:glutamate-1-semialdehyde 2,1-aminomutase